MKPEIPRYIPEVNTIVPKGVPFLRIGSNLKKIKKLQRRIWREERKQA